MFGFRQQNKRPCRNGLNCYYLRNGNCWFQHPEWHKDIASGNQYHSNPRNTSSSFSSILRQDMSLDRILELIRKNQKVQNKFKSTNLFSDSQDQHKRTIAMNGKQIELIKIDTLLDGSKSWFFKNCHHYSYFPESEHKECSICINNFQPGEVTSILFCKHAFHTHCIQKWLKTADKCPLCRKDFKDHPQFQSLKGYVAPRKNRFEIGLNLQNIELDVDYSAEEQFSHNYSVEISISDDQDHYQYNHHHDFELDYEDMGLEIDYDDYQGEDY